MQFWCLHFTRRSQFLTNHSVSYAVYGDVNADLRPAYLTRDMRYNSLIASFP